MSSPEIAPTIYSLPEVISTSDPQVFVIRDEGYGFVFRRIRQEMGLVGSQYNGIFKGAWKGFNDELIAALLAAFSDDEAANILIHTYPLRPLKAEVLKILGGRYAISTDPCIGGKEMHRIAEIGASRIFQLGGVEQVGFDARPGYLPLDIQLQHIVDGYRKVIRPKIGDHRLELIEDDLYTGVTARTFVEALLAAGVPISSIIACFKIGDPNLDDIPIYGAVTYPPERVKDFADKRDFVIGAHESGLVILHYQGVKPRGNGDSGIICQVAKAPYILPWVSPNARSSIPETAEEEFSKRILLANVHLYDGIARELRHSITLTCVNPHTRELLMLYGYRPNDPMEGVCANILDNFANMRERVWLWPPAT